MNILMLSSTFPYPPSRGGTEIRTFNLLNYLSQRHSVTLLTQRHNGVSDAEVEQLRALVDELVMVPLPEATVAQTPLLRVGGKVGRFVESLAKNTPTNVLYRYSPQIQAWVDAAVQQQRFDAITCEHSVNEIYIRPTFQQSVRTVVNVHSSVYAWVRNHLEMGASAYPWRDRLNLPLLYRYEQRYCAKFSQIVVTTTDDGDEIRQLCPSAAINVVPNGVDLELFPYRQHDPSQYDLIFVGTMDASHNIDAARFFALEVMPLLRQRYPEATFSIVGARPTAEVLALGNQPGVIVTGQVASMVELLHKATVCVVPLRTGFGIKNKTLEAMAAGVPIVSSDRGLEGLAVDQPDCPLRALRANHVGEYINAISRLFADADLRQTLSHHGRSLVETEYTWERVGQRYEQVCTQIPVDGARYSPF
ncbi:glycosyltransferase [Oculatella sp. LEGE 06141]|uniref:glycosyltransferase family 4 protein n=2 Tax=Oculatella sp. LEGE 06141 TaxID=1828648 RepID=UPI00187DDEFD|nr:glycosyltransferase family 4 protein [Oculatella sp. LEGE 06141]MBE9178344.1 glycosyltransferase [Oculatella sp. LEGE 06141]